MEETTRDLFEKSIRILELPRVLELLSAQAVSEEAKRRALSLRPLTQREEVQRLLEQTDAARGLIGLQGSPNFAGLKPVAESLARADRCGMLNTRELLDVAGVLRCARRVGLIPGGDRRPGEAPGTRQSPGGDGL